MRFLALLLAFATSIAMGQTVKSAKAEAEDLINAALPFAEKMLGEHGEFFPYAEALGHDGKFVSIGANDGRERPPSKEVIQLLKGGLKAGAKSGKYKATALVYDVRITVPQPGKSQMRLLCQSIIRTSTLCCSSFRTDWKASG